VFEQAAEIKVRVVALGTGQRRRRPPRDADVVFVHARAAEEKPPRPGRQALPRDVQTTVLIGLKATLPDGAATSRWR
jgi:ABC-type tungstate transport system permease subunit